MGCDLKNVFNTTIPAIISIHTSRMGCDYRWISDKWEHNISIHTSRMGCDFPVFYQCGNTIDFNPHIPHGMWLLFLSIRYDMPLFQSTHPAWDVTKTAYQIPELRDISIHTSRMGCDQCHQIANFQTAFQSTHPAWDVTLALEKELNIRWLISIHTSRMGCDWTGFWTTGKPDWFQSTHPAWDVTCHDLINGFSFFLFQSTHPAWDVTLPPVAVQ